MLLHFDARGLSGGYEWLRAAACKLTIEKIFITSSGTAPHRRGSEVGITFLGLNILYMHMSLQLVEESRAHGARLLALLLRTIF